MRSAVDNGATSAPLDMRYIKKTASKEPESTAECITFLEHMYQSIAETLPDVSDHSLSTSLADSTELLGMDDAYRQTLSLSGVKPQNKKRKGPRRFKHGLKVNRDRSHVQEVRFLPPGRVKDHYESFLAQFSESAKPPSFATFYRASLQQQEFVMFCNIFQLVI